MAKTIEELLKETLVPVEEQPYEIPENWVWSSIEYVTDEIRNGTTIKQNKDQIGIKVTRIESVQNNSIDFSRIGFIEEVDKLKEEDYYQEGDIALSHINSIEHVGKTALIIKDYLPLIHGMNLLRLRFNKKLFSPEFMAYYTQGVGFKHDVVERIKRAVNQVSLNQKSLKEIKVPLPPLPEQQRIVTKIESLFYKIDKAKELIEEAREGFENRKAAILAKAFRGEFTEKWREENIGIQSADLIIEDIQSKRLIMYEEEKKMANKENRKVRYNKPKYWGDLEQEQLINYSDLPCKWKYTCIGNIAELVRGGSPRPSGDPRYYGGDINWIIVGEITKDNNIYLEETSSFLTEDGKSKSRFITRGTLLITNSGATLGVPKISNIDGCINDGVVAFAEIIDTDKLYLYYYLKSQTEKFRNINQGAAQPNLNTDILNNWIIPFPPLEEQQEIVRILDNLLSFESKVEELTQLEEQIELLKKSILAKAFRGELGTNDPTEESAMELLKDVLKEKIK